MVHRRRRGPGCPATRGRCSAPDARIESWHDRATRPTGDGYCRREMRRPWLLALAADLPWSLGWRRAAVMTKGTRPPSAPTSAPSREPYAYIALVSDSEQVAGYVCDGTPRAVEACFWLDQAKITRPKPPSLSRARASPLGVAGVASFADDHATGAVSGIAGIAPGQHHRAQDSPLHRRGGFPARSGPLPRGNREAVPRPPGQQAAGHHSFIEAGWIRADRTAHGAAGSRSATRTRTCARRRSSTRPPSTSSSPAWVRLRGARSATRTTSSGGRLRCPRVSAWPGSDVARGEIARD